MKYCHDCGLSIGETATFCATCGALVPSAPPCTLCGRDADDGGVCPECRAALAPFVARSAQEPVVSLATSEDSSEAPHPTVANAIYSAVGDAHTCPACAAADGTETADPASAAAWAPNPRCTSPDGCRCLVFFEHERLDAGEVDDFVAFAAHGLGVTASAVAAFHADVRERRELAAQRCSDAAGLLRAAAGLEKPDPEQAVALYRKAIDDLLACGSAPLDERAVRRDLPLAFNRITLVLKGLGRDDEALDELDRAASWGIPERADCGRKSDRDALRNRARRLREHGKVAATA